MLNSVDALRNGGALWVLLATFSAAGLLLTLAQAALARQSAVWAAVQGGLAFFVTFYGSNAVGLMLMDQALGKPPREASQAIRDALSQAHRMLLLVLLMALTALVALALSAAVLWVASAPRWGPPLLGLIVPVFVPAIGLTILALVTLCAPLAAPAIWYGLSVAQTLRLLCRQARQRFVHVVMLTSAVGLLSAAMAAMASFVVLTGGRILAWLAVLVAGIDLTPDPFMAALFGKGFQAAGPAVVSAHNAAAHTGAGVVFAVALVVPGLVYLRGLCAVFLTLHQPDLND